MMWGKAPYAPARQHRRGRQRRAVRRLPALARGDIDANGDGVFNTDHFNGGIAGIVHYGITRAENDPRWAAAENWEPGVSDVRVQLWDENRTHLLNEVTTDNWNNSRTVGLPVAYNRAGRCRTSTSGRATDCFDGLRNFNQARPALFDGGYAFSTILQDGAPPATSTTDVRRCDTAVDANCRNKEIPIPAGKYVVKIIVPPGLQAPEGRGQERRLRRHLRPAAVLAERAIRWPTAAWATPSRRRRSRTTRSSRPSAWASCTWCPPTLSLFPGQLAGTFAGEKRPLCDAKLVTLRNGQQAAPDFHLFTEAPVAGHIYGMVLDDTTNEFDPNAPTFGEKYAVPFIGVAFRDWQGREITRTYTDQYGMYNALVPTTYTINPPEPSGVSPSILSACINPPTMAGPGGSVVPDPHFQKQYSHFCYPLQYLPGKTTYLDTPVLPTGAFTGNGTFPVDAELPERDAGDRVGHGADPVANPTAPDPANPYGPYIVDRGATDNASRTIVDHVGGQPDDRRPDRGRQPGLRRRRLVRRS